MTEDELKRLKDLPVPAPGEGARAAAIAAALAAFERAAVHDIGAPQGNAAPPRLRDTTSISEGNNRMRFRRPVAIAASIVVLALVVPFTLHLTLTPRVAHQDQLQDKLAQKPREDKVAAVQVGKDFAGLPGDVKHDRETGKFEPIPAPETGPKSVETKKAPPEVEARPPLPTGTPGLTLYQPPNGAPDAAPPRQRGETIRGFDRGGFDPRDLASISKPPPASVSPPATGATTPTGRKGKEDVVPPVKKTPKVALGAPAASEPEQLIRFGASSKFGDERKTGEHDLRGVAQAADDGRDRFATAAPNPVKTVASEPVSTFSIDVDSASYAFVRRALNAGKLPPKAAVRVEEMINYFPYDYPLAEDRSAPFRPTVTVLPAPWNPANKLVHIAIKGYDLPKAERPRANLVLLIDTSGSMSPEDRLPLLKNAFRMLIDTLRPEDTVGIVTYAGQSRVALESTKVADKHKILQAIDGLGAGGSTAGGAGIQDAYRMAEAAFDKAAVNRVILATDGDFNVGITNRDELKSFIERKRETGVYLSVLGVGRGNYNDALMQALAQNGNGTAAYIDTLNEARKVLVDEVSSTLFPIAKDVKVQIEFNPAIVAEYRLIGYETRLLRKEDFNNDKIDAGDIGSGHTVTAIYEITPVGSPRLVDDLRYKQPAPVAAPVDGKGEYAFLRMKYKLPAESVSRSIEVAVTPALEKAAIDQAPADVRFSVAVAAFGQLLRGDPYLKSFGYDDVIALAATGRGEDPFGYRAELLNLVRLAKSARP